MFHLGDTSASSSTTMIGATHVYIPSFAPKLVIDAIETECVTHALLVPTMVSMLINDPGFEAERLRSLQVLVYGASPMPEGILREALAKLPFVKFVQGYGQTELAPTITILPPEYHVLDGDRAGKLRSAGRAVAGCEVRIVDGEGRALPSGEVGEIVVSSPGAMHGYWNMPEQTAEVLRDGWVHTGDGGYMDEEGFVFIVDRIKDMIVTGGENVFSAEVESVISTHPGVAQVAVIGIPSEKWGEAVHAIVVKKPGAGDLSEGEIADHCRGQIANFKIPRSVSFRMEPLPLSGAGKVLKRVLRAPYWEDADRNVG
jgi:acyl-CoA synthetase (AMP-forming)/AMP-acid ligase II